AAWPRIAAEHPDAELVLAGPIDKAFPPPSGPRVHYLGMLPHARTAELFSALDVGVIYLRDTAFGRYCFPQKAYEMLACELPIAAAGVGVMTHLLESVPDALYRADDAADLARAVSAQIERPLRPAIPIDDWATVIGAVEPKLRGLVPSRRAA
ncbi:MAG TPA: glycosyltransferase, partial [Gammaproteobacteria bacterium]|nr:glycosyltransferase [Gammaproteobacteria bacterium]